MSQPTTASGWADLLESRAGGLIPALYYDERPAVVSLLRKLAEIEDAINEARRTRADDARPEQPAPMGEVPVPRPPEGTVILVDGERYCVGPDNGKNMGLIYKLTSFGTFERTDDGARVIYWPNAVYSRVEACERGK